MSGRHAVYWFCIGGHKPLAHLPAWKRRLLHLPYVRWRLWPRPWNFNGPVHGYRADRKYLYDLIYALSREMPYETQERIFREARAGDGECVCGEINTRHCPVHGQGDTE